MSIQPCELIDTLLFTHALRNYNLKKTDPDKNLGDIIEADLSYEPAIRRINQAIAHTLKSHITHVSLYTTLSHIHSLLMKFPASGDGPEDIRIVYQFLQGIYTIEFHRMTNMKKHEKIRQVFEVASIELQCYVRLLHPNTIDINI